MNDKQPEFAHNDIAIDGGIHFHHYFSWKALLSVIIPAALLIGIIYWKDRPIQPEKITEPENPSVSEVQTELNQDNVSAKEDAIREYGIGNTAYQHERFDTAVARFKNALNIAKSPGFYFALGNSYFNIGSYPAALENYQAALALYRKKRNSKGESDALSEIGLVYTAQRNHNNALKYHKYALAIARQIRYTQGEAVQLNNIGNIYCSAGDNDTALIYFQQAESVFRTISTKPRLKAVKKKIKAFIYHQNE